MCIYIYINKVKRRREKASSTRQKKYHDYAGINNIIRHERVLVKRRRLSSDVTSECLT